MTIGSAVTEIVFALGEKSNVVAIDLTSMYVAGAEGMTNVGYMRALSTEGVLSQAPDLMCVSSDSGPPEVLDALRASGIPFALIPHVPTIEGIKDEGHACLAPSGQGGRSGKTQCGNRCGLCNARGKNQHA